MILTKVPLPLVIHSKESGGCHGICVWRRSEFQNEREAWLECFECGEIWRYEKNIPYIINYDYKGNCSSKYPFSEIDIFPEIE